ncbi:hypothetical protein [Paenibacillus sp. OAS669]|uniref:hypothetical protein n=1 Tax=Paenibacillus sp. OAS669 TaxID=2663821 RepID=UPI00178B6EEF|nr:hypothetical protein [Paenibacillus sp. OAS669]MBE1442580.1 hypothetical protein [Paenibacillus sp. OAS669]
MQTFDTSQINNLLTGVGLACEIESVCEKNRAFIKVKVIDQQKYLNRHEPDLARFFFEKIDNFGRLASEWKCDNPL